MNFHKIWWEGKSRVTCLEWKVQLVAPYWFTLARCKRYEDIYNPPKYITSSKWWLGETKKAGSSEARKHKLMSGIFLWPDRGRGSWKLCLFYLTCILPYVIFPPNPADLYVRQDWLRSSVRFWCSSVSFSLELCAGSRGWRSRQRWRNEGVRIRLWSQQQAAEGAAGDCSARNW
jgi:hypothetical protein